MAGGRLVACHCFIYDRLYMFRLWSTVLAGPLIFLAGSSCLAQSAPTPSATDLSSSVRAVVVQAESGHCAEALPELKKTLGKISDKELKRKVGLDGVRCAMTLNQPTSAVDFLQALMREFPRDPEVLYVAVHAYSDLSTLASQQLASNAPSSYQAHELLAESFEMQGKWDDAQKEYRTILKQDPKAPGIHFRLGRLLLSKPNPSPEIVDEAKKQMEQELEIDPSNAGAEYVLGALAQQKQDWENAIPHFTRAAKLDPNFGDALIGLGTSLNAVKRYSEAIPPLESAVKLEPKNPAPHYLLAIAYTRSGRKQDGEKEFAIHRQLTGTDDRAAEPTSSGSQPQ
jgi:tetratricopeptide (TPR) repeat protein